MAAAYISVAHAPRTRPAPAPGYASLFPRGRLTLQDGDFVTPVCSNCGASDFVWANELKTGSIGGGSLSLRARGELSMGTRLCRACGHADLFLKDPAILRMPHTWKPGEFVPIPVRPPTPSAPPPPPAAPHEGAHQHAAAPPPPVPEASSPTTEFTLDAPSAPVYPPESRAPSFGSPSPEGAAPASPEPTTDSSQGARRSGRRKSKVKSTDPSVETSPPL